MKKVKKPYHFNQMQSVSDFKNTMKNDGLDFPVSENLDALCSPFTLYGKEVPNRMGIQPLEGFDGLPSGAPSDLIFRRYHRYASGGSGLIWYESIAISADGRCNPLQMVIHEDTVPEIARLIRESNEAAANVFGSGHRPYNIIQLTHSGRRSTNKDWEPTPLAAALNPYMDDHNAIDGRSGTIEIATDEKIEEIIEGFIHGAELSAEAGFDAVDIKVCHEYILRELLSAFTRPGKYGGSFENRTRALFEIIDGIRKRVGSGIEICVRLNAYDCVPYPYGWGMVQKEGVMEPDLTEPVKLCRMLVEKGVKLINLSTMMPRYRPYGAGLMAEHNEQEITPYAGTYDLLKATRDIKKQVPGGVFMCTGLTWLEQFGANVGAGGIEQGWFDIAGFGRQAFAYPDYAKDVLEGQGMQRKKCCITCDKCYDLIQIGHTTTGCVVRDQEVYLPLYRKYVQKK
ncbi:NADH:flavin oxidoreductase [Diplocloster agilis]|uniref:NADH:flavin oxidoreductase n=1 Tax=Diplocloster agilis TaxID=2850323 RepID=A0A949JX59_9FIRM|nr:MULTISPECIES: NADH:flavin oxidoreductase [Lachnospiraceae]MBU9735731.1 NADH:flavin oxidoreductase [Diplocloster agilis]MBU9742920.1 NADH:flavin oxidoreductase [Diplocloster agilis]MCU6732469.1 NADH:flavin oxidoreductase [Suonthocola fibrivorans]SCI48036.1 NADPH dehydrogenase [uncultured Clostridium sp.]